MPVSVMLLLSVTRSRTNGLTFIELILVIAALGLGISMLWPANTGKRRSPMIKCVNNLKNIGLAFRIYASDNDDLFPMSAAFTNHLVDPTRIRNGQDYFQAVSNQLAFPNILSCPLLKQKPATNFAPGWAKSVSYLVGMQESLLETNGWLAGDQHLEVQGQPESRRLIKLSPATVAAWRQDIHFGSGNICFPDGYVGRMQNPKLPKWFISLGKTNWVVRPTVN